MRLNALPFLLALTAGPLIAQTEVRTTHGMTALPDQVLGSGQDYVIEFGQSGVDFVPALGRSAAVTRRLHLERGTIRAGDFALGAGFKSGIPRVEGDTAIYELGGGISEHWTAGPEGVELAYVLQERPPADGDFVVTLRTSSNLPMITEAADGGWYLLDANGSGVHVGAVTGVAADGARTVGWIEAREGELELGLPGSFVRDAAYPLVLDPLFSTVFGINGSADSQNPVVATMGQWGQRLVAWELVLSASDIALQAQRLNLSGAPLGGLITLQASGQNANLAAGVLLQSFVANTRFVVAWDTKSVLGDRDIISRVLDSNGNIIATLPIATTPGVDEHSPTFGSSFLTVVVAWVESGAGIRQNTIQAGPALGLAVPFAVTNSALDHSPTIGRAVNGTSLLVWVHDPATGSNTLRGRVLGTPAPVVDILSSTSEIFNPDATSYISGDFVVAYEINSGSHNNIWAQRVRYRAGLVAVHNPVKMFTTNEDERFPALASAEREVVLAVSRTAGTGAQVVLRFLDPLSLRDIETQAVFPLAKMTVPDAAGYPGTLNTDIEFLAVWTFKNVAAGGDTVYGQVAGDDTGTMTELDTAGCDAAGAEPRVGAVVSAHPAFSSELHGAQAGVLAILGVGFVQLNIPWGGGFLHPALSTGYTFITGLTDATGYARLTAALPPNIQGVIFWEQWALFGLGTGCSPGAYDITDALELIVD